ncbi:peptide transporter ptr2 [Diatrype stigma]|uniref:Peptide transporter ptr2 n=1 Tax=Diatrype stigma TaxID=117547 RepID=A0AAN9VAX7_9PEZI
MPPAPNMDVELEAKKQVPTTTACPDPMNEKSLKKPHVQQRSVESSILPSGGSDGGSAQDLANQEEGQCQADATARGGGFSQNSEITRIPYPISKAAWIVIMVGSLERMAFYGGSTPFQNYIQRSGHDGDEPGRLGKGQVTATALNQFFYFLSYLTPIAASVICDSVSGKYPVILVASIAGVAGWGIMAGTSVESVSVSGALAGLVVGMATVAASSGGVSSIVPAFAADQARGEGMSNKHIANYSPKSKRTTKVVYDASLNVQHIFHWYYLYINAIGLVGSVATPFIEIYSGYVYVFLFATATMVAGCALLMLGKPTFKMVEPQKGLMADCVAIVKLAFAERKRAQKPGGGSVAAAASSSTHFLDRSKVSFQVAQYGETIGARGVADKTVDDLKQALTTLRILPALTVFWLAFNQCSHNLLSQAAQMTRPAWLSNDLMTNVNPITLTFIVPFVDHLVFPWLRKKGWEPTPLKRIAFGFLLVSLGMVYAAVLQAFIYRSGPYYDHPGNRSNEISVWWQLPPYMILALAEIFAVITALEYAYNRSPPSMKTIVSAMNAVPNAGASLLVYCLLPLSKDPYLTWNFATIALISFITMIGFWWGFRKEDLEYEDDADDKQRDAMET